jgi:hypothetical protein
VKSTVALWAASASAPKELAQAQTGADGRFEVSVEQSPSDDTSLYLIATGGEAAVNKQAGDNLAIALMTVVGNKPPANVTINEMTTIASVWTHNQFLDGAAIKGSALALRIAAGNVRNLVDLETGGLGPVIQDPLNSSQTATLATFSTLANLLAGCITRVQGDACNEFFAVATPPAGVAPADTLMAAQNIAHKPSHQAQSLFALLDAFYPVPAGELWRPVPFIPYLSFAPTTWTVSLVYAGGGMNSLGGIAIDGEGNMWADDNFLVGSKSTIYRNFGDGISKLAPNGRPLSPYRDGGIDAPALVSPFPPMTRCGPPVSPANRSPPSIATQVNRFHARPAIISANDWVRCRASSPRRMATYGGSTMKRTRSCICRKGDATKGRILRRTVNGKPVDEGNTFKQETAVNQGIATSTLASRNPLWTWSALSISIQRPSQTDPLGLLGSREDVFKEIDNVCCTLTNIKYGLIAKPLDFVSYILTAKFCCFSDHFIDIANDRPYTMAGIKLNST